MNLPPMKTEMFQFNRLLPVKWRKKTCYSNQQLKQVLPLGFLYLGSLTALLREKHAHFEVRVLSQKQKKLRYDEYKKLKISQGLQVMVREVVLLCDGLPKVFARSIMPAKTLVAKGKKLKYLNNQPLIEMLNTDPALKRTAFEISSYQGKHYHGWGRRSIFYFYQQPILLEEYFVTT